jgi:non-ribosomal peptide synthase protein (TIGR01720 family)
VSTLAGTSISDALHYALARALSEAVATQTVKFRTIGYGRSPIFPDIDLSRTVGFLLRDFPVLLRLDPVADHLHGVRAVRAQLQAIPHHGLGFTILRDLGDRELASLLDRRDDPPVTLNYEGDIHGALYEGLEAFRLAGEWKEVLEAEAATDVPWHSRIDVTVNIEAGDLLLWTTYHERAYRASTIERLVGRMAEILAQLGREGRR